MGTEAAGLLLMDVKLIDKKNWQVGRTNLANSSSQIKQFWVLKLPAALDCMQEATMNLLRQVAACQ